MIAMSESVSPEGIKSDEKKVSSTAKEIPVDMAREDLYERNPWFPVFLSVSFALVVMENILVAFRPDGVGFTLQIIVLVLSSALFVLGVFITANSFPTDGELVGDNEKYRGLPYYSKLMIMFDGEVQLEFVALIVGWACLWEAPGKMINFIVHRFAPHKIETCRVLNLIFQVSRLFVASAFSATCGISSSSPKRSQMSRKRSGSHW